MFVQAAIEELPHEFTGIAEEIHIHFPWGSLLRALVKGEGAAMDGLHRIAAPECLLEILIGIDPERDGSEIDRLDLPEMTMEYIHSHLIPRYERSGFRLLKWFYPKPDDWSCIESTWARKLSANPMRTVICLVLEAV